MADVAAYLALFALGVWPAGIATLAMRNEVPPGSLDLAARIEPDMQQQSVLISGAEAENHLVDRSDITGVTATGISEDEFEQQGAGASRGERIQRPYQAGLVTGKLACTLARRFSRSIAWSTAA